MRTFEIPEYRVTPARITGIDWMKGGTSKRDSTVTLALSKTKRKRRTSLKA